MMHKLWMQSQLEEIKKELLLLECKAEHFHRRYHHKILCTLEEYISLLNKHYGEHRNPDTSLGGWLGIFLDESLEKSNQIFSKFLIENHLTEDLAEIKESIVECQQNIAWCIEVFLVSSDYSYILIFPQERSIT